MAIDGGWGTQGWGWTQGNSWLTGNRCGISMQLMLLEPARASAQDGQQGQRTFERLDHELSCGARSLARRLRHWERPTEHAR